MTDRAITRRGTGFATAFVLDRRSGMLFEASNGRADSLIAAGHVHPVLADRYSQMMSRHSVIGIDGSLPSRESRWPPHPDEPLGHAEVKAVNDLLWQYGLAADTSVLRDMTVEVVAPFQSTRVRAIPFCANCAVLLHDVPSINGRFTGWPPGDHNFRLE